MVQNCNYCNNCAKYFTYNMPKVVHNCAKNSTYNVPKIVQRCVKNSTKLC